MEFLAFVDGGKQRVGLVIIFCHCLHMQFVLDKRKNNFPLNFLPNFLSSKVGEVGETVV